MASDSLRIMFHEWHVKVAVLSSLLLQLLLLLLATFRKRTANTFLRYFIYGIYLLSTKVAFATFYLNVGARFFAMSKMPYGLWAAVMVLHLAGQERLTAYSVEDNQLWRSSTLYIILQLLVHLGLFIPQGDLPFPTRIMLCLAVWRIACRAIRLKMGTKEMMVSWVFPFDNLEDDDQIPSKMLVQTDADDSQVVCQAHFLLKSSTLCLLAEVGCTTKFTDQVSKFFQDIRKPEYAIRIAEIELNFIYDSFHTDGTIRKHLNHNWSLMYAFLRSIESLFCVAALIFYIISSSSHLHSADISRADYDVTYVLLWGTVTLEFLSYIMTVFSDWTIAALIGNLYGPRIGDKIFQFVPQRRRWSADYNNAPVWVRVARHLFRRWSETISKFNFISYSIQTSSLGPISKSYMRQLDEVIGTHSLITSFRFVSQEWYTDNLGKYVFKELQKKDTNIITSLKTKKWQTHDSYRIDVLVWHIATELMFISSDSPEFIKKDTNSLLKNKLVNSKLLSDYMAYLLFMKPHFLPKSWKNPLMKSEAAQVYIQDIAREHQDGTFEDRLKKCCQEILKINIPDASAEADDYVKSLSNAIAKFNDFDFHNANPKDIEELLCRLSQEWVDILLFAASKYDKIEHIQGLCQGGELISIVWLLAFHLKIITFNNMNIHVDTIV